MTLGGISRRPATHVGRVTEQWAPSFVSKLFLHVIKARDRTNCSALVMMLYPIHLHLFVFDLFFLMMFSFTWVMGRAALLLPNCDLKETPVQLEWKLSHRCTLAALHHSLRKESADFAEVTSKLHGALRQDVSTPSKRELFKEGWCFCSTLHFWPCPRSNVSKQIIASQPMLISFMSEGGKWGSLVGNTTLYLNHPWLCSDEGHVTLAY